MKRTDRDWIADAASHLEIVAAHLQATADSQLVLDAAALRLSAAIDSVAHVSEPLRASVIPDPLWRRIKGTRNRIAHEYGFVDRDVLRTILEKDVAAFAAQVAQLRTAAEDLEGTP
ncbi:MAG: HepT-like ribonuclease domain-containing protein [Pseudolysinimonas sp.]|uniref:HepT-like ribonuclease domain-containing protein n=1 Tax=Pseudolysinimonas sp. TaxID=2680009 RepID=UPI003C7213BA